jgi:dolichol-phosphate mannosyltransferase
MPPGHTDMLTRSTRPILNRNNLVKSDKSESTHIMDHISIIIPVFNEEAKISAVLKSISEFLKPDFQNYEIILINDGSEDNTLKISLEAQRLDSHIKVLSYGKNRGKGYAVRQGVLNSIGDIVIFLDGDLDISHKHISDYIKHLGAYDLVIASKTHPLSVVTAPVIRKFLSRMFNLIVRLLLGITMKDTQSGLKVGRGLALRTIFENMFTNRYAFDVELLVIASRQGLKIKELPITITLDCLFNVREAVRMFLDILRIAYKIRTSNFNQ